MINQKKLLNDLKVLLKKLEDDLRERCESLPEIDEIVRPEYENARASERTALSYAVWRDEYLTQVAVAWILGCVFIRFMEDNDLIEDVCIAGSGERLQSARDEHALYFREHPRETDREYLLHVFTRAAELPAVSEIFDRKHNPVWKIGPSGDGAGLLLGLWH